MFKKLDFSLWIDTSINTKHKTPQNFRPINPKIKRLHMRTLYWATGGLCVNGFHHAKRVKVVVVAHDISKDRGVERKDQKTSVLASREGHKWQVARFLNLFFGSELQFSAPCKILRRNAAICFEFAKRFKKDTSGDDLLLQSSIPGWYVS